MLMPGSRGASGPNRTAKMVNVAEILTRCGSGRDACIKILQEIQATCGYLPAETLREVTERTRITLRQIYSVATFYEWFRFKPLGKHVIRTCHGTACHVNGAKHTTREVQNILNIQDRETTPDGLFTLDTVACLGCCSLAPVMMIGDDVYGRLSPKEMRKIINEYKRKHPASPGQS
jgi:NADH:ubiquinone oxidoreductase subunit E